jgi:hypothetical protein
MRFMGFTVNDIHYEHLILDLSADLRTITAFPNQQFY